MYHADRAISVGSAKRKPPYVVGFKHYWNTSYIHRTDSSKKLRTFSHLTKELLMPDNTIELMGQKLSYPTTWQGAFTVTMICFCITFLGYTLDANQIKSYSGLFSCSSEEAYNESLSTIAKLNSNIGGMQLTINALTQKANLAENEKTEMFSKLETDRKSRELAIEALSNLQAARVAELAKTQDKLPLQQQQQQQQYLSLQAQQIQQQLGNVQQQQQQQLRFTQ